LPLFNRRLLRAHLWFTVFRVFPRGVSSRLFLFKARAYHFHYSFLFHLFITHYTLSLVRGRRLIFLALPSKRSPHRLPRLTYFLMNRQLLRKELSTAIFTLNQIRGFYNFTFHMSILPFWQREVFLRVDCLVIGRLIILILIGECLGPF
jgi:hypothetical protein